MLITPWLPQSISRSNSSSQVSLQKPSHHQSPLPPITGSMVWGTTGKYEASPCLNILCFSWFWWHSICLCAFFSDWKTQYLYVEHYDQGYCKAKISTMGFSFFQQMARECVEMDCWSFVFALRACEQFCAVLEGVSVHCWLWKMGFESFDSDLVVRNGLVHFYAERGCLDLRVKCLIKVLWEMWLLGPQWLMDMWCIIVRSRHWNCLIWC